MPTRHPSWTKAIGASKGIHPATWFPTTSATVSTYRGHHFSVALLSENAPSFKNQRGRVVPHNVTQVSMPASANAEACPSSSSKCFPLGFPCCGNTSFHDRRQRREVRPCSLSASNSERSISTFCSGEKVRWVPKIGTRCVTSQTVNASTIHRCRCGR